VAVEGIGGDEKPDSEPRFFDGNSLEPVGEFS
jgi:hypothetical protein